MRTELVPSMIEAIEVEVGRRPIDAAFAEWTRRSGHGVAYALPSLVDHLDVEPTITTSPGRPTTWASPCLAHRHP